ncbi:hypothetical protein NLI96_g6821 [Meripilus lineatus]|uniref:Uncharacterized protein n=1 Tax=Meripilus lineatus TaxID=2056292 RepID=A0AAD5V5K4_9APHY|nr:hypothetical protein NLI96_g6821 [Physisporinus lineatus]
MLDPRIFLFENGNRICFSSTQKQPHPRPVKSPSAISGHGPAVFSQAPGNKPAMASKVFHSPQIQCDCASDLSASRMGCTWNSRSRELVLVFEFFWDRLMRREDGNVGDRLSMLELLLTSSV